MKKYNKASYDFACGLWTGMCRVGRLVEQAITEKKDLFWVLEHLEDMKEEELNVRHMDTGAEKRGD